VLGIISAALADSGLEVYAIDLPGHGNSEAKFQTDLAEQSIRNTKAYLGEGTIVLGHSLGAGLLLDLAASEHFSTLVLLSPPPLAISEIHADHVLIATGEIDVPRIRSRLFQSQRIATLCHQPKFGRSGCNDARPEAVDFGGSDIRL